MPPFPSWEDSGHILLHTPGTSSCKSMRFKLYFRAGDIFSTLCSTIFGCLSARCCRIFCKLATLSEHMVCGLCKELATRILLVYVHRSGKCTAT
jgi:hypothetical protein